MNYGNRATLTVDSVYEILLRTIPKNKGVQCRNSTVEIVLKRLRSI